MNVSGVSYSWSHWMRSHDLLWSLEPQKKDQSYPAGYGFDHRHFTKGATCLIWKSRQDVFLSWLGVFAGTPNVKNLALGSVSKGPPSRQLSLKKLLSINRQKFTGALTTIQQQFWQSVCIFWGWWSVYRSWKANLCLDIRLLISPEWGMWQWDNMVSCLIIAAKSLLCNSSRNGRLSSL